MDDNAFGAVSSSIAGGDCQDDTIAIRTAFVARFIVLREGKRTKAHRKIELLRWHPMNSASDLALALKIVFFENGDDSERVDRDIRRALIHAERSHRFFLSEYTKRATETFMDALRDYERSNVLLFGSPEIRQLGGWRPAKELVRNETFFFVSDLLASNQGELSLSSLLAAKEDDEPEE